MKKLKLTFLYNNVHFLAISVILLILTFKYIFFLGLLIPYLIFIFGKTPLFKLTILLLSLVAISYLQYYPYEIPYHFKGIIVDCDNYKAEILTKHGKVYLFGENEFSLGDYIDVSTKDYHFQNQAFNYQEYLENKGIKEFRKIEDYKYLDNYFVVGKIQNYLAQKILSNNPKTGDLLVTLLVGQNELSSIFSEQITKLGISHLLAISGLHITILISLFELVLDKFFYFDRPKEIILTIFLLTYIIITNFSISVIRAAMLVILKIFFKQKEKLFTTLDCLSMITIVILFFTPKTLFLVGFELSFLLSFIMITFIPLLKNSNYIVASFKIGFIAFLVSLPIVINVNYEVNLLTILVSPLYTLYFELILLPLSVILVIFPFLEYPFSLFFIVFEKSINVLSNISIMNVVIGKLSIFEMLIYYLVLFSYFMFFNHKKKKYILYIFSLFLAVIYFKPYLNPFGKVAIYDVGQGDAILISLPHNQGNILYDCYGDIVGLLKKDGIRKLDAIIISHGHSDHVGKLSEVMKFYNVNNLYTSQYDTTNFKSQYNYSFKLIKGGDLVKVNSLQIKVLGPIKKYPNENDNSLVIQFELEGIKYLLTGDIETNAEKDLAEKYHNQLKSDVLKVAHHGSKTSSIDLFLKYVNPHFYAISVGYNNYYGLPNHETLLNKKNVYRTDVFGTIYFNQKKSKIFIKR